MATSTATLSAVLTLDDRASPGLVKTTQSSDRLRSSLLSTGQSLATFASSMASLLVTTGALESKTGQYATAALSVAGAVFSIIGPLTQLNSLLRTTAVLQAFLTTLKNPIVGAIAVGAAGAAAITAGALIGNAISNRSQSRTSTELPPVINQTIDLRGATVRGEDDINELSRQVSRSVPKL